MSQRTTMNALTAEAAQQRGRRRAGGALHEDPGELVEALAHVAREGAARRRGAVDGDRAGRVEERLLATRRGPHLGLARALGFGRRALLREGGRRDDSRQSSSEAGRPSGPANHPLYGAQPGGGAYGR